MRTPRRAANPGFQLKFCREPTRRMAVRRTILTWRSPASSLSRALLCLCSSSRDDSYAERALPYGRRPDQPSSSSLARRVDSWWVRVVLESVDALGGRDNSCAVITALMDASLTSHRVRLWQEGSASYPVVWSCSRSPSSSLACAWTFIGL